MGVFHVISNLFVSSVFWRCATSQNLKDPPYSPPAINFDEVEIWPLSGGLHPGVRVSLSVPEFKNEDPTYPNAQIDFLTKDYEVAFRFGIDKPDKMYSLYRTSYVNGAWTTTERRASHLMQGSEPFDFGTKPFSFDFLLTRSGWQLSVNGKRMPWLDFKHKTDKPVVYAALGSSMHRGLLTDSRPECTVECNPEECVDENGASSCPTGTKCTARIPVEGKPDAAQCTADTKTVATPYMNCCDGWQLKHIPLKVDPNNIGKSFRVHDNKEHVKIACEAFGAAGSADAEKCKEVAGTMVEVKAAGGDDTKEAYAVANDDAVPGGKLLLPPDVLIDETGLLYQ